MKQLFCLGGICKEDWKDQEWTCINFSFSPCRETSTSLSHHNIGFIYYIFFRNWADRKHAGTRLNSLAWKINKHHMYVRRRKKQYLPIFYCSVGLSTGTTSWGGSCLVLDLPSLLCQPNQREVIGLPKKVSFDLKNPAYGRHRISRPMIIEAPIQKKTYKDFSSSSVDLVKA